MALASLTENYTDSEGEEPRGSVSPLSGSGEAPVKMESPPEDGGVPGHLVSYQDDTVVSDDERGESVSEVTAPVSASEPSPDPPQSAPSPETDVEIPPEPAGRCSNELQEKISKLHDEMTLRGLDMNKMIQKRKDFRNPSIYEKLIQFCRINEFGTNYSPDVYDPLQWGKASFYDELAKSQKAEMDHREKERREKTKVEVLMGTAKKSASGNNSQSDEDAKRRKSKWDQVGSGSQGIVKPPGLLPLTSTATGTKGTVISAFGSLPKKQRV